MLTIHIFFRGYFYTVIGSLDCKYLMFTLSLPFNADFKIKSYYFGSTVNLKLSNVLAGRKLSEHVKKAFGILIWRHNLWVRTTVKLYELNFAGEQSDVANVRFEPLSLGQNYRHHHPVYPIFISGKHYQNPQEVFMVKSKTTYDGIFQTKYHHWLSPIIEMYTSMLQCAVC